MSKRKSSKEAQNGTTADEPQDLTRLIDIIEQDTANIVDLRIRSEQAASAHQRLIEKITHNLGRPRTFYTIICIVSLWIILNLLDRYLGLPTIDAPQFPWLQGLIGLISLLTTTCVLITQNRQERLAEQHNHLDLELSLLVERKVSKLIALVEELRQDLPNVENRHDQQAEIMKENVDPELVLSSFQQVFDEALQDLTTTNIEKKTDDKK